VAIVRAALGYELTKEQVQLAQVPSVVGEEEFQNLDLVQEVRIDESPLSKDSS
jgi:hypothetical protein